MNLLGSYYATDSRPNLTLAFGIYTEQFSTLDSIEVDEKTIPVERFINGDYKYEADSVGHQGASSSFPCLYGTMHLSVFKDTKLKHTPYLKGKDGKYSRPNPKVKCTMRTIEDYKNDYIQCMLDTRKDPGKFHHSITGQMLFPVKSVLNIVPVPLHITLGLGDDFFSLTEQAAIDHDMKKKRKCKSDDEVKLHNEWKSLSSQVEEIEKEIDAKEKDFADQENVASEDKEEFMKLKRNHTSLSHELENVHSKIESMMGPCQSQLYQNLNQLGVSKTTYHGGTLVGNHIKATLNGTDLLCSCLKGKSPKYNAIRGLWQRFANISPILNASRFLTEEEIEDFCQNCYELGDYYCTKFKERSITRKMHILIFHCPQFARRWGTIGLLSEQKLESLHSQANKVERSYAGIRDGRRRSTLVLDACNLAQTADRSLAEQIARKCECGAFLKKEVGLDIRKCQGCGKLFT